MADSNEPATMSYVAAMDSVAYARVVKKNWRRQWRSVVLRNAQSVAYATVLGACSACAGSSYSGADFRWRIMSGGAIFAAAVTVILIAAQWDAASRNLANKAGPKSWQCAISDSAYTFTDQSGIAVSIPWSVMRVELEDPDAWLILYPGGELVVFRKPLRNAGFEEEFRRRVCPNAADTFAIR